MTDTQRNKEADLSAAYGELCKTYNAIRDFRAKLLGFLPLASGGGIFLLLQSATSAHLIPAGLIGAIVTRGLWLYEKHNMDRCHDLIRRGAEWEKLLTNDRGGQFRDHPVYNHPEQMSPVAKAAGIVYGAVLSGWGYVVVVGCYRLWAMLTHQPR